MLFFWKIIFFLENFFGLYLSENFKSGMISDMISVLIRYDIVTNTQHFVIFFLHNCFNFSLVCYEAGMVIQAISRGKNPWVSALSANPTKWSSTLKQFVGKCRQIAWVFDHFVRLALKGLRIISYRQFLA